MSYYRDQYFLQVLHSVLRPPKAQNNSQSSDNVKPEWQRDWPKTSPFQRGKKVVSDSAGLVDFAIGLVNSVFNLPDGQVMFFLRNSINRRTVKSILLFKKLLGLVEMKPGLVYASFSLPKWKAVKMIFLCILLPVMLIGHNRDQRLPLVNF